MKNPAGQRVLMPQATVDTIGAVLPCPTLPSMRRGDPVGQRPVDMRAGCWVVLLTRGSAKPRKIELPRVVEKGLEKM